jgi:hypothetical protein
MKRFLAAFLVMLTGTLTLRAQEHNTDSWVTFTSDTGNFSVLLPEIPTDKVSTTQSDHGPYTTHLYEVRSAKSIFLVGWVDYDPSFNFDLQKELDANRDNFVNGMKEGGTAITLVSTVKITLNGNPGIEFIAETPETVYKSRVYIVERRPYQIIVGTSKFQDDAADVGRFLNSFAIKSGKKL